MSHSQFHCTGRVYLDLHGLIFETSICYWQDQPGSPDPFGLVSVREPECPWPRLGVAGGGLGRESLRRGQTLSSAREAGFGGEPEKTRV